MEAQIREGQAPAVIVSLQAGELLTSEAGAMTFVSGDISMEVEMPGGLAGGLKRKLLAGESLFVTRYRANGPGSVGITGPFPGSIRQHELDGEIICEKHAYLGHHGDVEIESAFAQKLGMGVHGGGEGFFLQRLKGKGTVWLHGGGDFLDFDLAAGQRLIIDTGCMVMIEPTVKYDVKLQGGVAKSLFGGEGLFLVHMTGPGHVTLQTPALHPDRAACARSRRRRPRRVRRRRAAGQDPRIGGTNRELLQQGKAGGRAGRRQGKGRRRRRPAEAGAEPGLW